MGMDLSYVVYVYEIKYNQPNYTVEIFEINEESNTWTSTNLITQLDAYENFKNTFHFELNVQPEW